MSAESPIRAAYTECRRLARRHYENFPVASWLVPSDKRDALAAIYAFARAADDFADEPAAGGAETRLRSLAAWRRQLDECYDRARTPANPLFIALGDTVERFRLSRSNFDNLITAFEQDVRVNRYPDFASVLEYCRYSANPVGRLVLELFGHREPELVALSDHICTALQLANFWQDVAVDLEKDRLYLPLEDLDRFGYSLADLGNRCADERWRRLLGLQIERTRELFQRGRPLTEKVAKALRVQLRLTWLGGRTILDKAEAAGYDVFRRRPKLSLADFARLYFRARRPLTSGGADRAAVQAG